MTAMPRKKRNIYLAVVVLAALAVVFVMMRDSGQQHPPPGAGKNVMAQNVDVWLTAREESGNCTLSFEDKEDTWLTEYEGTWDKEKGQAKYRIHYKLRPASNGCAKGRLIIPEFRRSSASRCSPGAGTPSRHVFVDDEVSTSDRLEVRTDNLPAGTSGVYCYDVYLERDGVRSKPADPEIDIVWQ